MCSIVLSHLERFGPERCEALSIDEARAYCHDLATRQYENFTVVSRLLPRGMRPHFAAVYAFCRWADDLGDETGDPTRSRELLDWWREELDRCYAGEPRHPVFVALRPTIERFDIPRKPFDDLIDAFVQDQRVHRYETWEQVVDYCTRSADPVGRLVLSMCGYRDEPRRQLSDATCTALQLANFWQDVRRDILERDRIYLPAADLATHGLTHDDLVRHVRGEQPLSSGQQIAYRCALRGLVIRTWPWFETGRQLLPHLDRGARLPVRLFTLGGESLLRRIAKIDYATLDHRPSIGRGRKVALMGRGLVGHLFSTGARRPKGGDGERPPAAAPTPGAVAPAPSMVGSEPGGGPTS